MEKTKIYIKGVLVILACAFAAFYVFQSPLFYSYSSGSGAGAEPCGKKREIKNLSLETDISCADAGAVFNRRNAKFLLRVSFDTLTKWPKKFPADFSPEKILETGKNPGLGIRDLHKRGFDGGGVAMAVLDRRLYTGHEEYSGNLKGYGEYHYFRFEKLLGRKGHGEAMVSVMAGKTCGVAPGAGVYYTAVDPGVLSVFSRSHFSRDLTYLAKAADRALSRDRGISALVFASVWPDGKQKGYAELLETLRRLSDKGVFIASPLPLYGYKIASLTRDPLADPDSFSSYSPFALFEKAWGSGKEKVVFLPGDSRTVASPRGPREYSFLRRSKYSVAVSYLAGLWALCRQAKPDLKPRGFMDALYATSRMVDVKGKKIRIADPAKLVGSFASEEKEEK